MTEEEVYKHLLTRIKPYIGVMPQGSFSNNMIRFKAGLLKPATIKFFFTRLGYEFNPVKGKWHYTVK
jgi:hypothetical protein